MNLIELQRALRQLRLGGVAAVLETRLHQAQSEAMAPIDLISCLISDELSRRSERLLDRRRKQAEFRDAHRTLDQFDFNFNPKMNRSLVFDLATCAFIGKREDALFLGPGGTGKSHLAQAIGQEIPVQWDHRYVRLLHPQTGELLREHLPQVRGKHRIKDEDRPKQTPPGTQYLLLRAGRAGQQIGAVCRRMYAEEGQVAVRRIQGVLALAKRHGPAVVDEACDVALEIGASNYYHLCAVIWNGVRNCL